MVLVARFARGFSSIPARVLTATRAGAGGGGGGVAVCVLVAVGAGVFVAVAVFVAAVVAVDVGVRERVGETVAVVEGLGAVAVSGAMAICSVCKSAAGADSGLSAARARGIAPPYRHRTFSASSTSKMVHCFFVIERSTDMVTV